ncbi:MAG: hypothetical protein IJB14_05675 [Firmicutes bacterium]|nr:hypothetical protein [Bacillota bacterium]
MTYVIGAIAGLIFGGIAGALKNRFIWGSYLVREDAFGEAAGLYGRMLASNIVNVITLVIVFFLRNIVPFDGIAFLIGTAVAMTLMNKVLAAGQKKNVDKWKEV